MSCFLHMLEYTTGLALSVLFHSRLDSLLNLPNVGFMASWIATLDFVHHITPALHWTFILAMYKLVSENL